MAAIVLVKSQIVLVDHTSYRILESNITVVIHSCQADSYRPDFSPLWSVFVFAYTNHLSSKRKLLDTLMMLLVIFADITNWLWTLVVIQTV